MTASRFFIIALAALPAALIAACESSRELPGREAAPRLSSYPDALLVSLAVLGEDAEGKPLPQPARLGILAFRDDQWRYTWLEDPDSNVFHKAMGYEAGGPAGGVLTFGGTSAAVKLWPPDGEPSTLWQANFGGKFSRMRDAELADIYGDGRLSIAVATHDQGVVAVLRPGEAGEFTVEELDRQPGTIVHEIEVGDLDGNRVLEIYATPSEPNKLDGTPQPGKVVRYVPAAGQARSVVADLGERHAKEILVADVDGDGRDELYVSVEAVSGGKVEIRRYDDGESPRSRVITELDDTLCRFLTAGDVDGDGRRELVAAAFRSGLWLLRPGDPDWRVESIDTDSSGFEHAAVLADLDGDEVDELYVASDRHDEIRRYVWIDGQPVREVIHRHADGLSRFTWNLTPVPVRLLPGTP